MADQWRDTIVYLPKVEFRNLTINCSDKSCDMS